MIHPSGTFEYRAVATEESFVPSGSVFLHAEAYLRPDAKTLVGPNPEIRLVREQLVVWAQARRLAALERATFRIGDALLRSIQPGDELYAVRSGNDEFGASVLRRGELAIAFGAVSLLPLGQSVAVEYCSNRTPGAPEPDEMWLELRVGDDCKRLTPRVGRAERSLRAVRRNKANQDATFSHRSSSRFVPYDVSAAPRGWRRRTVTCRKG